MEETGIKVKKKIYPELPPDDPVDVTICGPQSEESPFKSPSTNPFTPSGGSAPLYPLLEENLDPCPVQKHYRTFLEEYIQTIEEILEKFEEIKKRAQDHHYKSNCAKVSGTVVSTTGVALVMSSLVWAPLTIGSSLAVGAGGAVMSVTGSLTNVVTDYIDYKTTAIIMEDIKLLLKEKEMFDAWMRKSLDHFNECIDQLIAEGITRDVAVSTIIEAIAKGAINIMETPNNQIISTLSSAVKLHHIQHLAIETLPVLGKTFHMTEKSFQFVYNILGLTGRTVPTLIKDFAKISGVLSIAFAMADISLLIKDLCSEHPSVELIDKVVRQLEDEKNILDDLLDIMKAAGEHKEGILERAMKDIEMLVDKDDLLQDFVIVNKEEYYERSGIMVR